MNDSTSLARAVLQRLLDAGVREVVIAPGSRNAPLSFAAFDAAAAGLVRLHTRIDERSAGFLALGMTRAGARAAVVCTSGTAVANLHPAVLEAAHSGADLVVVTADRPARLRGTDANQTTDQVGVFGRLVPTHDVASPTDLPDLPDRDALSADLPDRDALSADLPDRDALSDRGAGPLHLNVQFDEPLLPPSRPGHVTDRRDDYLTVVAHNQYSRRSVTSPPPPPTPLPPGPRTVVVAGDDAGPAARRLAEQAGWPLFAEPSSGSRTGANALRCYRLLLDTDLGRRIERVVVYGRPTLSRPVSRLLARDGVEVLAVPGRGVWAERPYPVVGTAEGFSAEPDAPDWLEEWRSADREVARGLDRLLAAEPGLTPHEAVGAVSRALPAGGLLVVGPSSPVRDLDLMARPYPVGERRKVVANRGLAGIDGVVSTAIGHALGRRDTSRALALMGDVTFLHDSNGLILGPGQPEPDLTIVVVNDDGGSIFTMLEQGAPEHAERFEALFGTPHGVDIGALCAATRTPHLRVDSLPELDQALASPNGGLEVVEVVVRRDTRRDLDARIRALPAG